MRLQNLAWNFIKVKSAARISFHEFCKFVQNIFSTEHLRIIWYLGNLTFKLLILSKFAHLPENCHLWKLTPTKIPTYESYHLHWIAGRASILSKYITYIKNVCHRFLFQILFQTGDFNNFVLRGVDMLVDMFN